MGDIIARGMAGMVTSRIADYTWNIDHGLRNYRSALARAYDSASNPPNIVILGDSITDGTGATSYDTSYAAIFKHGLQLAYGLAGYGFKTNNFFSIDGTWTTQEFYGTNLYIWKATPSSTPGTLHECFLSIDVLYTTQPDGGTATVQIDGSNVGTINCNGPTSYHNVATFTATSFGYHTVEIIPATSGNTYIEGFVSRSGLPGVLVHKVGHPGIKATHYTDQASIVASTSAFNPVLTIIMLGTNDAGQNVPPSSYQAALDRIVKQALITGDVLIMIMGDRPDSANLTYGYVPYVNAAKQVAMNNNCAYLSIYDAWQQSYTWANTRGLMDSDGSVHPSQEGHAAIAQLLFSVLGGISPQGAFDQVYEPVVPYGDILLRNVPGATRVKNELKVVQSDGSTIMFDAHQVGTKILWDILVPSGASYAQINLGATTGATYIYSDKSGNATLGCASLSINPSTSGQVTINGSLYGNGSNRGHDVAVTQGATTATVSFTRASGSGYSVQVTPNWNTTYWVTNKTTTGFTVNFGTPAPSGATFDWFLIN
ncbi:MAG: SGNH/GDSL hydrolase family protein [Alicyclobacillus sp.]|nr:SGNH/GDSL hydrolase family protein [Alicyclobacillus sp.]